MLKKFLVACVALTAPLVGEVRILAFSGSTRADSYNKKLVKEAAQIAREMGATVTIIDLKDFPLPFYDADLEISQGMPDNAKRLRQLMKESHAILIASPEYNGSLSAVLKNTLDWASRSEEGKSSRGDAFKGKKFALMSASPSKRGGARSLAHVRAVIEDIGGEVMQQQVTVGEAPTSINPEGVLQKASLKEDLRKQMKQLLQSIQGSQKLVQVTTPPS